MSLYLGRIKVAPTLKEGTITENVNTTTLSITPTEIEQIFTPVEANTYYSSVTCDAISKYYVGSSIPTRDANSVSLTSNKTQLEVPYGLYGNRIGTTTSSTKVNIANLDSNLTSSNIKSGINIFGVEGSYEAESTPSEGSFTDGQMSILLNTAESVVFPEGTTEIRSYSLYGNSKLKYVEIPNSVTSIGERALVECTGLTSITIPNSVTSIGYRAFSGCSSLENIIIPNSVTIIGNYAFNECNGLTSVYISNSVKSIGEYTFYNCYSLTSITIPNSVTSIGWGAFFNCRAVTRVVIPDSVTSIENSAFYNCGKLTKITFNNTIATWNNITKGNNWNKNIPSTCVIHCTDGDLTINGEVIS